MQKRQTPLSESRLSLAPQSSVLSPVFFLAVIIVLAAVVACSPQQEAATQGPTLPPAPTETLFPTYSYILPTDPPAFGAIAATRAAAASATAEATESAASFDMEMVERGKGRYESLGCAECHGDAAQGTDNGPSLLGPSLEFEDFLTFLRTGGTVGNDHLYASNRLSEGGARNVYEYIRSLSAQSG